MNKQLLVESKVGGYYCDIVSRMKGLSFLFNEKCIIFDSSHRDYAKISRFIVVFPFSYDFLIKSSRKQHGLTGYMNLISVFFKNRFKNIHVKLMRASVVSSRYKWKNKKMAYIGLTFEGFFKEDEHREVFIKLFESFSDSFAQNSKELEKHILDENPYRYKYID